MAGRKLKDKPARFIRSAGGRGASAATLRSQADTPVKLLEELVARRLDPRDLSKQQRKAVLLLQAGGKHTSAELATLLAVSPSLIRKDLQEIRREIGREVQEWSLEDVVGGMVLAAERYQAQAVKQEDVALAWTIERDKVKLLKELGLVGARDERDGVKLTLEVLGKGYERARVALGRALDPSLTGQVVDVEVGEPDPLALSLARRVPGTQRRDLGAPEARDAAQGLESTSSVPPEQDASLGGEVALEDALEQDLQAALEGPAPGPVQALSGEELEQARAGVTQALSGQALERARKVAGHPQA